MNRLVALIFAVLFATPVWAQQRPPAAETRPAPKPDPRGVLRAMEDAFSAVADRVTPAVVHVSTVQKKGPGGVGEEAPERFREFFGDEFYERYFRRRPREDTRATGSGVLGGPKGYILTNNHVVENAQDIIVRLSDQRKFTPKLVGRDPKSDIAVLKADAPPPLPAPELGDSHHPRAGSFGVKEREGVLVAEVMKGSPAETAGLKAGDVVVELSGAPIREVPDLQRKIAAIRPGQTMKLVVIRDKKPVPVTVKIGEMPADEPVVAEAPGNDEWGLSVEALTGDAALRLDLPVSRGLFVTEVQPGSPAEKAGIRRGDVILEISRRPADEPATLFNALAPLKPGESILIYVHRTGSSAGGANQYLTTERP